MHEDSKKPKIAFKTGLLFVVIVFAFCFFDMCINKSIWGISWEDVFITSPLMAVVVLVASYLLYRRDK